MKHIVLVDPAKPARSTYGNATALSIYLLREIAERKGHHVTIINLSQQGESVLFETIRNSKPDIVGFTATSPAHAHVVALAKKIRAEHPETCLIKGGVHEKYGAAFSRRDQSYPFDISFQGESDCSFASLLDGAVRGPIIHSRDLSPAHFVIPRFQSDMLEAPFELLEGTRMLRMQSMRGCGFACVFCAIDGISRRLDPRVVVEYLQTAHEAGADRIFFEDATFTIDRHDSKIGQVAGKHWEGGWTYQFSKLMKATGLARRLSIGIQTRIDCLDSITDRILLEGGVKTVYIGIESLGESVDVSKGVQGKCDVVKSLGLAIAAGLKITTSLMGDLGTDEEFVMTVRTLQEIGVHEIFMEASKIFPGTGLSKEKEEWVLEAYEQGIGITGSVNPEDDNCLLERDISLINRRYVIADQLLSSTYKKVDEGHYIRL